MRKVEFLEGLPALNTEIFNRLVKYLTEDLKLRFNDIFEPGILPGYPNFGEEFLIKIISFNTSDPNKKISFSIGPGIAYVSNNNIVLDPNDNSFVGDGFFERIYLISTISEEQIFDTNTTLYIYITWEKEQFNGDNDKFTNLFNETETLYPFVKDSYEIIISTTEQTDSKYLLLGKINIFQTNGIWNYNIDTTNRKYFRLRIKEEDFKSYLSFIFKNGVITTREKDQQNITYNIELNKLYIQINDGLFDNTKDLFFINGHIIQNFDGLNSYINGNKYSIDLETSSYDLYIQQVNNYETVTFSLKSINEIVNDGIKLFRITYNNGQFNINKYDIFNIIDPVKTIGNNSIPLKLIKYDSLDLDDKNVVKEIFDKITNDIDNPQKFIKEYHIADNTISTNKIQDYAITTNKISNGAITDDKISPLTQRKSISYSFPRYMTQNITGNITTGTLTKFFIGQKMRLSRIAFIFESIAGNSSITLRFLMDNSNINIFKDSFGIDKYTLQISNSGGTIQNPYIVIDYNGIDIINSNISIGNISKLNDSLYNGKGILFYNNILSILVDNINNWSNSFMAIELELEEYSGNKNDPSSVIVYPTWRT
jgi:hypothetical protein